MNSARLLFITPGNNITYLVRSLPKIASEQGLEVELRNLLTCANDISENAAEIDQALEWADVILFDIRDGRDMAAKLGLVRQAHPEKTFIPLMGGSLEVMGLCRMGSFNFDRLLKHGGRSGSVNFRRIEQITSLVEKLGSLLPIGSLGHARNWIRAVRYWTAGGQANMENLLRLVLREYCGGKGRRPGPPIEPPLHRLESALDRRSFTSLEAYLKEHPFDGSLPTIALLYYGGLHHEASSVGAAAIERCLAGRANLLPIATDGVRSLEAVERYLCRPKSPRIDAIINLMWFRLNGGPLGGDPEATTRVLKELDVPYIVPVTLYNREYQTWLESQQGVSPVEAYATVVLPELDGATGPIPLFALEKKTVHGVQVTEVKVIEDRLHRLCERLLKWIELRRTPKNQRRLAIIVYDYPPGPASLGNASYLDVSQSLANILNRLRSEGHRIEGDIADPLDDFLKLGVENSNQNSKWFGEWLSVEAYLKAWREIPEEPRRKVEQAFGPPPGRIMIDEKGLRIPGRWFGNVFVGIQPARTSRCRDPRQTHDRAIPPHHQYIAFYTYLRQNNVHAVIHLGTHGTVEFLPGKELAPSRNCFPDLLQGDLPQLYVYTIANPSESTLARRRWQATLISHHIPDLVPAGLYGEYQHLLDQIERSRDHSLAQEQRAAILAEIEKQAEKLGLENNHLDALEDRLRELQHAAIPEGLHVFGKAKDGRSLRRYLVQISRRPLAGVILEELAKSSPTSDALNSWIDQFVRNGRLPEELYHRLGAETARQIEEHFREISSNFLRDGELQGLLHALDGRFLAPGLLGDPIRSPAVYPTGRDGVSFDPTRIPHPDAVERGAILAQALLEKSIRETGRPPRTVGLILWGFETARTGGETIGKLLYLVGARLRNTPGWLPSFEPIPMAELKRTRVDVYLMMCGFFRDMFPTLVRDLDLLLRRIASLDEPAELNPARAVTGELAENLEPELAAARIFGPRPGEYGTGMPDFVEESAWNEEADLGRIYESSMGYAYGARLHGVAAEAVFREHLRRTEVVAQIIDGEEYKIGDLDHYYEFLGGATRAVANARGEAPQCLVGDSARARPRLEEASRQINHYSITRLLNPKWIEGMLAHKLHGGRKIEERITNLLGLAGTIGVPSALFDRVFERYVADEEIFNRLRENNPHAVLGIARRLDEAHRRRFWQATKEQLDLVRSRYLAAEDFLEEVSSPAQRRFSRPFES